MKQMLFYFVVFVFSGFQFFACQPAADKNKEIVIPENGNKRYYGTVGSDSVYAYTLRNSRDMKAVITNYGGTLLELWTPDKSGKTGNVVLGL